jgi:thioesterase domain-containing protein
MAQLLVQAGWQPCWRSLVAIQPTGDAVPLFAVPGVGGNVLVFARLARLLGTHQPFYGLQAKGLDGTDKPFTCVHAAAAHYVNEIRSMRPHGPYFIGGACTGGVFAYEIAQQLIAQGEKVALAMWDTEHPSAYRLQRRSATRLRLLRFLWSKLKGYAAALADVPLRDWPVFLRARVCVVRAMLAKGIQETLAESSFHVEQVVQATLQAVSTYEVKEYPGRLLNVIATNRTLTGQPTDTRYIWQKCARGASPTVLIPAEDSGRLFVSPHVEQLASRVARFAAEEFG